MNILFATPIEEKYRQKFLDLCSEIRFTDRDRLTPEDVKEAEVILGNVSPSLLKDAEKLKWLQLDSAGAGSYSNLPKVTVTNASGAYGEAISEHMLGVTLAIMKNLYRYQAQSQSHSWNNLGSVRTLSTSKVLSVGMGNIGSSYARKMAMLGAEVYGIRRTMHEKPDYLKELTTMDHLDELLPMMDVVALSLPGTASTQHLFDLERLRKMKTGAILINVGRGSAIDTEALIKVMHEGKLSGAGLDVTEQEPLPKNSALWNTENVYITPHISGRFNAAVTYEKVLDIFYENLGHYLKGEPLEHVVDQKQGY